MQCDIWQDSREHRSVMVVNFQYLTVKRVFSVGLYDSLYASLDTRPVQRKETQWWTNCLKVVCTARQLPPQLQHERSSPRSQGLSSYRPLERAKSDPGWVWSRATLTIENIREGSSVISNLLR